MSFDGVNEELAILDRLEGLAGGRILDNEPDDQSIPVDTAGRVRPYIVLSLGVPFAKPDGDRGMADGEGDIEHTLTVVVGTYAGDRASLNSLYKAVVTRLVDFSPGGDNSTALRLVTAIQSSRVKTETRPATMGKIIGLSCTINLASG